MWIPCGAEGSCSDEVSPRVIPRISVSTPDDAIAEKRRAVDEWLEGCSQLRKRNFSVSQSSLESSDSGFATDENLRRALNCLPVEIPSLDLCYDGNGPLEEWKDLVRSYLARAGDFHVHNVESVRNLMTTQEIYKCTVREGPDMLRDAIKFGETEILKNFLAIGFDPNAPNHCQQTLLHYAAQSVDAEEYLRVLLDAGAENRRDMKSKFPYHYLSRDENSGSSVRCRDLLKAKKKSSFLQLVASGDWKSVKSRVRRHGAVTASEWDEVRDDKNIFAWAEELGAGERLIAELNFFKGLSVNPLSKKEIQEVKRTAQETYKRLKFFVDTSDPQECPKICDESPLMSRLVTSSDSDKDAWADTPKSLCLRGSSRKRRLIAATSSPVATAETPLKKSARGLSERRKSKRLFC